MHRTILVAGATGNLGHRICRELIQRGAPVRALVRAESASETIQDLQRIGVDVRKIDFADHSALVEAMSGVSCVVSALAGLRDVIVDTQLKVLNAAASAGVPRFIPSDFSTDFTHIPAGENRNFDLRKEFAAHLDQSDIRATSIFNGAFADILRYNTPLFNVRNKTVAYYGDKQDWKIDFTTMDDTASYTAAAALDDSTPRALRIASFQVSPADLVSRSKARTGTGFELIRMGSMEEFSAYNRIQRSADPGGEEALYPGWQQSQYLYSMFLVHHETLDNDRYPGIDWSPVEDNL